MIVYCVPPIDFWYGWTRLKKVLRQAHQHADYFGLPDVEAPNLEVLEERWQQAQDQARKLGWEVILAKALTSLRCRHRLGSTTSNICWLGNSTITALALSPLLGDCRGWK